MFKSYYEKLKDPRWQKKRLEVFQAHNFKCQKCGTTKSTLHVHHKLYRKNCEPWEYNNNDLCVLCETCHGVVEYYKSLFDELLNKLPTDIKGDMHAVLISFGEKGVDDFSENILKMFSALYALSTYKGDPIKKLWDLVNSIPKSELKLYENK